MLLKQLKFQHYGPFASEAELFLEDGVTVLTGANDTGKSSVLSLIERACGVMRRGVIIGDLEVNLERAGNTSVPWDSDSEVSCEAIFRTTDYSEPHVGGGLDSGGDIKLLLVLPPNVRRMTIEKWRSHGGRWSTGGGVQVKSLPSVFRPSTAEEIGTTIKLSAPNSAEKYFLQAAFGPAFDYAKFAAMSDGIFTHHLSRAQADATERLRRFLPRGVSLSFHFQMVDKRDHLSIQLRDGYSGHTPFGLRGAGIRRLVSLMGAMVSQPMDSGHHIILLDEPENSLHADAQHTLRKMLETIARRPNIQVVYATHSPSMINTMMPSSIRVLERATSGDTATSAIVSRAGDKIFLAVRSSLGLTAADSLLFAAVTIIVEGPTEVYSPPTMLRMLHADGVAGFEDVPDVFGMTHILDGCGDEFEYMCRVAESHGARPIVFLDGDKRRRISALAQRYPSVPVLFLDGDQEFEELIPIESYFEALRLWAADRRPTDDDGISLEAYRVWEAAKQLNPGKAFTKRINRWLEETFDLSLEKPRVMKRALDGLDAHKINAGKLRELLSKVREMLAG